MEYVFILTAACVAMFVIVPVVNTVIVQPITTIVATITAITETLEAAIYYFFVSSWIIGCFLVKTISEIWWILCYIYHIITVIFAACSRFYYDPPDITWNGHNYIDQGMKNCMHLVQKVLTELGNGVLSLLLLVPHSIIFIIDFVIYVLESITTYILDFSAFMFNTVFRISIIITLLLTLFMFRGYVLIFVMQSYKNLQRKISKIVTRLTSQSLFKTKIEETFPSSRSHSHCVICWERNRNIVLLPCRHLCLCKECSQCLQRGEDEIRCPICRNVVDIVMPVFT